MSRKSLIICLFLLIGIVSSTQAKIRLIEMGVKVGISAPSTNIKSPLSGNFGLETKDKVGMHIGLVSRINLAMLHIQPELIYSMNKYKLTAQPLFGVSGLQSSTSKVKINTVDVPILVGLKLFMFRLNAGPVFNLMTESSVSSGSQPHSVMVSKPAMSYMLGFGVDLAKVCLDVRYHGQFARSSQSIQVDQSVQSQEFKTGLSSWMFSVGYMF